MSIFRNFSDALTVACAIVEKLRPVEPVERWPIREMIRNLPDRRCKQRIEIELFSHIMGLEIPPNVFPLEDSPVADGYEHLFDADDQEYVPPAFVALYVKVGGRRVLHAWWGDGGDCFAWIDKGAWLPDVLRWATEHTDSRRLANIDLARQLINALVRGGHFRDGHANLTTFCCDNRGFGGDLKIQARCKADCEPRWPYITPADGTPTNRWENNLCVALGRRFLFTADWGEGESGPVADVYSELGHFHEPLLRWALAQ